MHSQVLTHAASTVFLSRFSMFPPYDLFPPVFVYGELVLTFRLSRRYCRLILDRLRQVISQFRNRDIVRKKYKGYDYYDNVQ